MSTREEGTLSPLVRSRDDLVGWIAAGSKPSSAWRIGTEHEKFLFNVADRSPVPYEGPAGVRALMEGLIARYGWEAIREGETIIALKRSDELGGGTVSLEPGGQFELSGAILETIHQVHRETMEHLDQVKAVGGELGVGALGLGFSPLWRLDETPRMPKRRYAVMTRYMPQVGAQGLEMMYRTATIQVNLDFADEADMVQKLRVSLALQPIATALFAASPFTEGRLNGFRSLRSEIWRHTDPNRTGMLPFVFEDGMGFERYVDYALDVPMYFVYRAGEYIDVAGASFRDFLAGRLSALPGETPTIDDWSDHLTTLFPEVRLKRFLEMRGADGGLAPQISALPAFWTGLLYDRVALDEAWQLVKDWTAQERQTLRDDVPRLALAAPFRSGRIGDVAREVLAISHRGLARRARKDATGADERIYLAPLDEIVGAGRTTADVMLERFHGAWKGSVMPVFNEFAF
ncbi:MAG: glutamate--cysteine ligase [Hyphomicrobiaceae bacterium]